MMAPARGPEVDRILALGNQLLNEHRDAEAERAFARALQVAPASPAANRGYAIALQRQGQSPRAVSHLARAVELDPASATLRCELGRLLAAVQRGPEAVAQFEAALQLAPADAGIWHYYGAALIALGRKRAAVDALARCLALRPEHVETLELYARALHELGAPQDAQAVWARLAERFPGKPDYALGLAQAYLEDGAVAEALRVYLEARARFPDSAELAMATGLALQDHGDRAAAQDAFRRALALRPGWAYPLGSLLELERGGADAALVADAERQLADAATPDRARALVGFGLGKVYEARAAYERAFEAYRAANDARRRTRGPLDRNALRNRNDRIVATFTQEFLAARRDWGAADERPVFVVGMPRSGTTLIEQIIAAHPQAAGCGELPDLARIAAGLGESAGSLLRWPESATALTAATTGDAAARYLATLARRAAPAARRVVDKAPANFSYVGLIALLFPRARVIWSCRDPRDVGISIYSENFAVQQAYASSLEDIGFYFREQERLMRHWQQVAPIPIERVVYEELVAGFEPAVRRILAFLDLPFAEECLQFHRQERAVLTPSRWQVRQPLYGSSVGRWQRFEPWLGPLLRELAE